MTSVKCKSCIRENGREIVAEFTCFTCELDLCSSCSRNHKSHRCVRQNSEAYRQEIKRMWEEVTNEADGREKFMEEKAEIFGVINVAAEQDCGPCYVTGMCVLEPSSLVVCDEVNSCIKLFDLHNYRLQRYISLSSPPYDVTEVDLRKSQSLSSDLAVSRQQGTAKPRGLLAVTFPQIRKIVFLDLNYQSVRKTKVIVTEKPCFTIDSVENCIYVVYKDEVTYRAEIWLVYLMSSDGIILSSLYLYPHDIPSIPSSSRPRCSLEEPPIYRHGLDSPYIALLPGKVYSIEKRSTCVSCTDINGIHMMKIHLSNGVAGICADKTNENVYVICRKNSSKDSLFKCSSDLKQRKQLFQFDYSYMDRKTKPLGFYKDKLFVLTGNHVIVLSIL